MRILVSGFEPFLDEKINPSQMIVNYINSCDVHHAPWSRSRATTPDVRGVVLPVVFDEAFLRLERERLLFKPDVVVSFGLAGGRDTIDIEQIAVNLRGGDTGAMKKADNSNIAQSGMILSSAPLALPTTLPTDNLLRALKNAGVPTKRSHSAGTYVCNDLFFQMQNRLRFTQVQSGFIHVPRLAANTADISPQAWSWPQLQLAVDTILASL